MSVGTSITERGSTLKIKAGLVAVLVLSSLPACQLPFKVTKATRNPTCPKCETVTRTTPIRGVTYTEHRCPTCGRDYRPDWYDDRQTGGRSFGRSSILQEEVAVCDQCTSIISECAECKK